MLGHCNTTSSSYLDTPAFLSASLHYFAFISVPVHLFGAYCILFKTPPRMNSVKWSLLNFHFWSCFLDVSFSFLTIPFMLMPAFAGYPLGILNYFGVSNALQTGLFVTVIFLVAVSIIGIFESRLLVLISPYHCWRKIRTLYFFFNYTLALPIFVPTYLMIPDQALAREQLLPLFPCLPSYVSLDALFILTIRTRYFLWTLIGAIIWFSAQMVAFAKLSERILKKECKRVSERTAQLQRTFQKALILQLTLPFVIIFIPLLYLGLSVWIKFHYQSLNNISVIILSSHGFLSTIAMLVVHQPYREYTKELLEIRARRGSSVSGPRSHWIT